MAEKTLTLIRKKTEGNQTYWQPSESFVAIDSSIGIPKKVGWHKVIRGPIGISYESITEEQAESLLLEVGNKPNNGVLYLTEKVPDAVKG